MIINITMRIDEIVAANTRIKRWADAQADAESHGLTLTQDRNKTWDLAPANSQEIYRQLSATGADAYDIYSFLHRAVPKITDYRTTALSLLQDLGTMPEMLQRFRDSARKKAYDTVQAMQQQLVSHWPHGHLQLFMPRPQVLTAQDRGWYRRYDDQGLPLDPNRLEEQAAAPILTGRTQSPPGHNKPSRAFWTSTVQPAGKDAQGRSMVTSDWVNWVCNNQPDWHSPVGYVYRISPSARILQLNNTYDAETIYRLYGKLGADISADSDPNLEPAWAMRRDFPWQAIGRHWDAVNHRDSYGDRHGFMYGWDCESTAWLDTSVLQFVGRAVIRPCD